MLGIGGTELAIIIIFGFLIFGPDRLPAMGRTIGRAIRQFKTMQDQMNKVVQTEVINPLNQAVTAPVKKQGPKKKITGASTSKPETFAEKKARLAAEAAASAERKAAGESGEAATATPAVPVKKAGTSETFAERKARLDAQKAAEAAGTAKPKATTTSTAAKKTTGSAAKLYGIDKDKIAAARAAAAQARKGEQADA